MGVSIDLVLRIAGIGLITAVIHAVLKQAGKEDFAFLATLAGTVAVFYLILQRVAGLFDQVRTVFRLW